MGVPVELRPRPSLSAHSVHGDAISIPLTCRLNGQLEDVSGFTFTAQMRTAPGAPSPVNFAIDMTDAARGVVVIAIIDTTVFTAGVEYVWSCKDQTNKRTIATGTWIFDAAVTP